MLLTRKNFIVDSFANFYQIIFSEKVEQRKKVKIEVTMDQSRVTSATPSTKQEKLRQIELKKQEKLLIELAAEKKQIRDHLTREENFKSLSNQRGWDDWKIWCQEVAAEGLRDELCAVSQSVSCFMDRSRHLVDTIKTHRCHAEEQYLRNFQNHSEVIDYLMGELGERTS